MREGRLRQTVTETDEDTGRETENTQQCQAAAAADTDTGRCQRDEVRWKEIGGEAQAERNKINTCGGREGGREAETRPLQGAQGGATGRQVRHRPGLQTPALPGSRTRGQRLEEKTATGVHPETHFCQGAYARSPTKV